jgi:hypothetical protein
MPRPRCAASRIARRPTGNLQARHLLLLATPKGHIVRVIAVLMIFSGLILLSACTGPAPCRYPISGAACAADDPVHDLRAGTIPPM